VFWWRNFRPRRTGRTRGQALRQVGSTGPRASDPSGLSGLCFLLARVTLVLARVVALLSVGRRWSPIKLPAGIHPGWRERRWTSARQRWRWASGWSLHAKCFPFSCSAGVFTHGPSGMPPRLRWGCRRKRPYRKVPPVRNGRHDRCLPGH